MSDLSESNEDVAKTFIYKNFAKPQDVCHQMHE
jgi:hypothetical protein